LVTFCVVDRIVVLGNMQMQEVLIREVLLAFGAPVRVHLLVVDVVGFERVERQRLMGGQRTAHNRWLVRYGGIGVEVYDLDVYGLLAGVRGVGAF
jgi:hypothetical protein